MHTSAREWIGLAVIVGVAAGLYLMGAAEHEIFFGTFFVALAVYEFNKAREKATA